MVSLSCCLAQDVKTEDAYAVVAEETMFDDAFKVPQAPKPYKIAMFAWESLHSIAVGGVAPHLTNLAAGLERRGHEVHVYVRTGGFDEKYELIHGVHIHRISFDLCSDFVQEINNMVSWSSLLPQSFEHL